LSVDYDNRYTHFYGYPANTEVNRDTIKQAFNSFSVAADVSNARNSDFSYSLQGRLSFLQDKLAARESEFDAGFSGGYTIGTDQLIKIESSLAVSARKDALTSATTRSLFSVNPHYDFKAADKIYLHVGLNAALENDTLDTHAVHLYPDVGLSIPISDHLTFNGGLKGGIDQVSLRTLTNENLWVGSDVTLNHSNRLFDLSGSLNARLGNRFTATAGFSIAGIRDLYFFMNDSIDASRFHVIYDQGVTRRSDFFASLEYTQLPIFQFMIRGDYFSYAMDKLAEPWHKPGYELTGIIRYNLYKKILTTVEVAGRGGVKAFDPFTKTTLKLDPALDLAAKVEYRFSDKFSMFVSAHNLTGKEYPIYLNYPARGLQVLGGLCWSF
jgi:hypothetical protein